MSWQCLGVCHGDDFLAVPGRVICRIYLPLHRWGRAGGLWDRRPAGTETQPDSRPTPRTNTSRKNNSCKKMPQVAKTPEKENNTGPYSCKRSKSERLHCVYWRVPRSTLKILYLTGARVVHLRFSMPALLARVPTELGRHPSAGTVEPFPFPKGCRNCVQLPCKCAAQSKS